MTFREFMSLTGLSDGQTDSIGINSGEYQRRGIRSKFVSNDMVPIKTHKIKSPENTFGKSKKFTK